MSFSSQFVNSCADHIPMYEPSQFKKEDPEYVFQFIKEHPFATFVLQGTLATHIPILTKGSADDFFLSAMWLCITRSGNVSKRIWKLYLFSRGLMPIFHPHGIVSLTSVHGITPQFISTHA